jgi:hypothetical protein
MHIFVGILGAGLLAIVLVDAFTTVVLARRAQRLFRVTQIFYELTWTPYAALARRIASGTRRENYLSIYGPLSLLMLFGCWAIGLLIGFGLLQWSVGVQLRGVQATIGQAIYFSATVLDTLGLAEPSNVVSRWIMVVEAALGLSFLALILSYLPVFYQSFSSRELPISLLDARAGSPPTAAELVLRQGPNPEKLEQQLAKWEEWSAELLQSQLSYPMLAYFRSQHTNQSWLAALTAIVDASALVIVCSEGDLKHQAELTFAIGRHTLVDLALVFRTKPVPLSHDRLPPETLSRLRSALERGQTPLRPERLSEGELHKLRGMYESYAHALGIYFLIALPHWIPSERRRDNWQATAWERTADLFAVSDPFQTKAE